MASAKEVGETIGRAMARDARARIAVARELRARLAREGLPMARKEAERDEAAERADRTWAGLDIQDGDVAIAAGIEPYTPEWDEMERSARSAFLRAVGAMD